MTFTALLRRPSAAIPLLMSGAAFLSIAAILATAGITRPEDEGAPARVFQLLILLQAPLVATFAWRWLPRCPRQALGVMLLQIVAAFLAVVVVLWLESGIAV